MNEKQARAILKKERCCGKTLKIYELYLNGTEIYTGVCRNPECRGYIRIEIGQLDEEELDEMEDE